MNPNIKLLNMKPLLIPIILCSAGTEDIKN